MDLAAWVSPWPLHDVLSGLSLAALPGFSADRRQTAASARALTADTPVNDNVDIGATNWFAFEPPEGAVSVYITVNTCEQPVFEEAPAGDDLPALALHVSTDADVVGKNAPAPAVTVVEGFANYTLSPAAKVYIGISSAQLDIQSGAWNFEVAASSEAPFHSFENATHSMLMLDSDSGAALLQTTNLTGLAPPNATLEDWTADGPPLAVFVANSNFTSINGLRWSYCGLEKLAQIPHGESLDAVGVELRLTTALGVPQQQIYVPRLNASSSYYGFLARPSAKQLPAVGGGGSVFVQMEFATKRFANCAVVYGLAFCDTVAYAVPANPDTHTMLELAARYDNFSQNAYQNFNYSLQQIACDTTPSAQYSLAKTCDDCAAAYKQWLCAVTIPRCADWEPDPVAARAKFLQQRNAAQQPIAATPDIEPVVNLTMLNWLATNSSRNNGTIAGAIQPGPYSEILPCDDLCYELVRSCPASLGFACPLTRRGLEHSYGVKRTDIPGGLLSCSEPGSLFGSNAATPGLTLPVVLLGACVGAATAAMVAGALA